MPEDIFAHKVVLDAVHTRSFTIMCYTDLLFTFLSSYDSRKCRLCNIPVLIIS